MRRIIIGVFSVIVVVSLFLVLCTFRARQYETVILDRFGRIIENPQKIAYGWYLCYPTDKVVRLDNRLHVNQGDLVEMKMSDLNIQFQIFAAWQIDPKNASVFYRRFSGSDTEAQNFLATLILGKTRDVLAVHNKGDELFNATPAADGSSGVQTPKIEQEITDRVNAVLAGQGMFAREICFSRFAFPKDTAEATYTRMTEERKRMANRFIDEGNTESTEIQAKGNADAEIIRGKARREAEEVKAQAESEALRTIASMQQDPESRELYQFWLNLELYKSSFRTNTVLILTPEDSIMRTFNATGIMLPSGPATRPALPPG